MLSIEQIKAALADRRLYKVAEATGLSYPTLRGILTNPDANPTHSVMAAISDYLERGCVVGEASNSNSRQNCL